MAKSIIDPMWYIQESSKWMFPHWVSEDKRTIAVMQVYQAYLDESGTHDDSDRVVVAGFLSDEPRWKAFSVKWKAALDDWRVNAFHMSEFAHFRGKFKSWTEEERQERLGYLINLINDYTISSIAIVVLKKSFNEIMSPDAKALCGDAYGCASIACYYNLGAKEPKSDTYIAYIMDKGCLGRDALAWIHGAQSKYPDWVEETRIISLDFQDKKLFVPLQSADILAYEIFKDAERQFLGGQRKPRIPLKLLATKPKQWHYIDDDELRKVNDYLTKLVRK